MKSIIGFAISVLLACAMINSCANGGESKSSIKVEKPKQEIIHIPKGETILAIEEGEGNISYMLSYSQKDSLYYYRSISRFSGNNDIFVVKSGK